MDIRKNIGQSAFQLKIIAIIAMTIDHVGAIFFPHILAMRIIGRITMPIMAFFIVEGYFHTSNIKHYIIRLFIASFVSIIPYGLLFGWQTSGNIMLTLALGLLAIWCEEHISNKGIEMVTILFLYGLSIFGDWSIIGIIMIQSFYRGKKNGKKWDGLLIVTFAFLAIMGFVFSLNEYGYNSIGLIISHSLVYGGGCFIALPLINLYNNKQGKKAKILFYSFYPIHMIIILLVKIILDI